MNNNFAKRIEYIRSFEVDSTLDKVKTADTIVFSAGNPAPESYPREQINAAAQDILEHDFFEVMNYSKPSGCPELRQAYKDFLNRREAIYGEDDDILIMSGSQQTLDFAARVFCNEGDTILCESPTFMAAYDAFRATMVTPIGVSMDDDGVNLADLERKMSASVKPKFFYTIPQFQNPTGITMSLEKRRAVCELAAKYGIPVLEDDPYGELRFSGEALPTLKALDKHNMVIYAASMSKIGGPGLRVACIVAQKDVIRAFLSVKSVSDLHNNVLAQKIAARLLNGDIEAHLSNLRKIYKHRCDLMLGAIKKHFNPDVKYTTPEGGLFIWVTLPKGADAKAFVAAAAANNVLVVPGNIFFPDSAAPCSSFRLCYSTATPEQIEQGIAILGRLTQR